MRSPFVLPSSATGGSPLGNLGSMKSLIFSKRSASACASLFVCVTVSAVALAEPKCTCRYANQDYNQGTCVCMQTREGARLTCCDLVLNNTSWTFTGDDCPIAFERPSGTKVNAGQSLAALSPLLSEERLVAGLED